MATKGTPERVQKSCSRLTSVLASAVLEWCLVFLLLLDALFSWLVKKFARVCELQTPCLLCSRLDHILGCEKLGFYKDLICHSHKLEMSKLVYCHVHEKLSDVHRMCESCISSITTDKKSGNGAHKSSIVLRRLPFGGQRKLLNLIKGPTWDQFKPLFLKRKTER